MQKLSYFKYFFQYLLDTAIPFYKKIRIYLVIFYFFSPFDFIPDLLIGFGWLDDAVIIIIAIIWLTRVLERYAEGKKQSQRSGTEKTIHDVQYKVHHDDDLK